MLVAIGHSMIAEQVKVGGSIMVARGEHELIDPLLVSTELVADQWRLIADVVKEAIEAWPIKESEINRFARDVPPERFEIGFFALGRIADVIRNLLLFQKIENVRPTIHPSRFEGILLFGEI